MEYHRAVRQHYGSCTDIWSFEKSDPPNAEKWDGEFIRNSEYDSIMKAWSKNWVAWMPTGPLLLLCCIRMYQPNAAQYFSPWKPKDVPCTSPQTVPLRPTSLYYLFSSLTLISVFEWIIQGIPRSLNHFIYHHDTVYVLHSRGIWRHFFTRNRQQLRESTHCHSIRLVRWGDSEFLGMLSCHFVSPGMWVARHKCVQAKWNEWDLVEIRWWWNCCENKHKEGEEEESHVVNWWWWW